MFVGSAGHLLIAQGAVDTCKVGEFSLQPLTKCHPVCVVWSAGRLLIAQGAVDACKVGVSIAIRYSCKRPQFGEKMIMEYITQQRRLLPGLATTYAMQIAMRRLKVSSKNDM